MKFLFKVAKLLPRLEAGNEAETIATVNAISRMLKAEELDWHIVGTMLTEFTTKVAGEPEPEPVPAAAPTPRPGFRPAARPAQPTQPTWTQPPRPQGPPRPTWMSMARGSVNQQLQVVKELQRRGVLNGKAEKNEVAKLAMLLDTGLSLNPSQENKLFNYATRL